MRVRHEARAGVVDQNIDLPPVLDRLLHHGLDLIVLAHVADERIDLPAGLADALGDRPQMVHGPAGNHHLGAPPAELGRDLRADARPAARDDGRFACNVECVVGHGVPLSRLE